MKPSISIAAVVLSSVGAALASPLSPRSPPTITIRHLSEEDVGVRVAAIGNCPTDCWNEAAFVAGCDPNVDDDCLCGPFFDAVTECTSQTCSIADNLTALDFLEPACN